jgi:hypothetical protein
MKVVQEVPVRYAVVALALGSALVAACGPGEPPAPPPIEIDVLEVQPRSMPIYFDMIGQTSGSVDIPIRARVDGVLEEMRFLEGRSVKQGQLLYVIDPAPYESKVVEAKGRLAEARTMLPVRSGPGIRTVGRRTSRTGRDSTGLHAHPRADRWAHRHLQGQSRRIRGTRTEPGRTQLCVANRPDSCALFDQ